jgi:hypothetical protein
MIAASNAAWLGDLRRAIVGPNSVRAVFPALIGLETDSDAAMVIFLRRKTCNGSHAATVPLARALPRGVWKTLLPRGLPGAEQINNDVI